MSTPILIVLKDNLVHSAVICKDKEDLEEKFKEECSDYGVEACDENMDNGYMQLECGTSICMSWA